jgi:hypothetical protein
MKEISPYLFAGARIHGTRPGCWQEINLPPLHLKTPWYGYIRTVGAESDEG